MIDRDKNLITIRPIISSIKIIDSMSTEERFQNITLRPIIKLQNDLLVSIFKHYIKKHKNVFLELNIEKRLLYIDNSIHKDINLKNTIKGVIIGQFSIEEYDIYTKNSSALNKRMITIIIERLQSNIQLFNS